MVFRSQTPASGDLRSRRSGSVVSSRLCLLLLWLWPVPSLALLNPLASSSMTTKKCSHKDWFQPEPRRDNVYRSERVKESSLFSSSSSLPSEFPDQYYHNYGDGEEEAEWSHDDGWDPSVADAVASNFERENYNRVGAIPKQRLEIFRTLSSNGGMSWDDAHGEEGDYHSGTVANLDGPNNSNNLLRDGQTTQNEHGRLKQNFPVKGEGPISPDGKVDNGRMMTGKRRNGGQRSVRHYLSTMTVGASREEAPRKRERPSPRIENGKTKFGAMSNHPEDGMAGSQDINVSHPRQLETRMHTLTDRQPQDAITNQLPITSRKGRSIPAEKGESISQRASAPPDPDNRYVKKRHRVSTEEILRVKSSISVVDVIESYNLSQFTRSNSYGASSATAKACCPFHDDNNPSLSVDDSLGLYKCFACGAGGDVFNFVREYDYLGKQKSGREKMGYMAAVEYVAREFGDGPLGSEWSLGKVEGLSEEKKEAIRERERKKDRIIQANTAAAAFYTQCLATLPTAGKARAHLRSRDISPDSIRKFALGYAPDCYFGDERSKSKVWGDGSLVEYLRDAGFTPDEIVEAGLAIRTRKQKQPDYGTLEEGPDDYALSNGRAYGGDYSALMDRFRSRVIVPIMDGRRNSVIALGARHLETINYSNGDDEGETDHKKFPGTTVKYINSPESLVFTKKHVLFNMQGAKLALVESDKSKIESGESVPALHKNIETPPAVVIVEGYFDAIALSNVGVGNVVASMGTAMTVEQLKIAAEMANELQGRIIICMDSDDAGRNAVERLCKSNIISKVPGLNENELYVSTIPPGSDGKEIKDPSDYVQLAGGGKSAAAKFQEMVLNKAVRWDEWYVDLILSSRASKDGENRFQAICDEVSTFLATFRSPADRTVRAHQTAEKLASLIAENDNRSSSSLDMLRVQLELDILNMASRKAGVREAMERRIEQTDGLSGDAASSKMDRLSGGNVIDSDDNDGAMSKDAMADDASPKVIKAPRRLMSSSHSGVVRPGTRPFYTRQRPRDPKKLEERHLVPHFHGFSFKHQSDKDWLGLSHNGKTKRKMHLGKVPSPVEEKDRLRAETPIFGDELRPTRKKDDIVYFNSNSYLGQQYLSQEAMRAGYQLGTDDRPLRGESIIEFTQRKLFESNPDQLILQAESRLLHALSKFPQARSAMRTVYSSSTFGPANMRWTCEEREWLFLCLTGSPEVNPSVPVELLDGGTPSQLRSHLAKRHDCPKVAFNCNSIEFSTTRNMNSFSDDTIQTATDLPNKENNINSIFPYGNNTTKEKTTVEMPSKEETNGKPKSINGQRNGLLDEYFQETDNFPSFTNDKMSQEARAELTVQESVAILLRATALKRFLNLRANLAEIVDELDRRELDEGNNQDKEGSFASLSCEELDKLFRKTGSEAIEAQKSLYESDRSSDRVNSHLLNHSVINGVQYKVSQTELERLDKMMEEHISSLPEDSRRPQSPRDDDTNVFGADEFDSSVVTEIN